MATETSVFTRVGCERIMRFGFELAQKRGRGVNGGGKVVVVTKSNAQRNGMVFWDSVAAEVAKEFPGVEWEKMLVDGMVIRHS